MVSKHIYRVLLSAVVSKLINKVEPNTINEKHLISKSDKSKFEMNINNDMAIQGAKDLGCTVVNIGGNDLTQANKSSILALLWQIIKVSITRTTPTL
jgi:hypothetical protein